MGVPRVFGNPAIVAPRCQGTRVWQKPLFFQDEGGLLAVWAELDAGDANHLRPRPWMALHGGPGGAMGAAHVAPLRAASQPWFAFDQRNSGLSEDLDLSVIDLQRFIDDAFAVADKLGVERFPLLGGSWGGTLALAMAAYQPSRVSGLVLRAPFLPFRARVDAFFFALHCCDPSFYEAQLGPHTDTLAVCSAFLDAPPEQQLRMAHAWQALEYSLLGLGKPSEPPRARFSSDTQDLMRVRKYRLQAHFLLHDCFLGDQDIMQMLIAVRDAGIPVRIVQGLEDRVCPPGGARFLSEALPASELLELPGVGHLPDSQTMIDALARSVVSVC